jgi:hypothetical protein
MKRKLLLSIIIACCVLSSSVAQITKGSVWLGGSFGIYDSKNSNGTAYSSQSSYYFAPAYGKAIEDNLIFGGTLNLGYTLNSNNNGIGQFNEQRQNTYGAGVFLRKYVPITKGIYLFGNASAGLDVYTQKSKNEVTQATTNRGWTARLSAAPGASFKINRKLHLETGFNNLAYITYDHNKGTGNPTVKSHTLSAGASLNNLSDLFIGFRLLLSKS